MNDTQTDESRKNKILPDRFTLPDIFCIIQTVPKQKIKGDGNMKKILALVLALMLTVCAFAALAEGVMTHEDYVAAELETEVTVETYVQAKQGWWENNGVGNATIYTQAEDGAYFLYNLPMSQEDYEKLVPGTKIRVTGYKAEWAGEVEIIDATYEILEAEAFIAEAEDITALLGSDELINHQNELICVKGATVVAKKDANGNDAAFLYNWDGSGAAGNNNDLYFDVEVNGAVYSFTVESYLCGEGTEVYDAVTKLNIGDKIDVEGFLYWYNGAQPHVTAVKAAE